VVVLGGWVFIMSEVTLQGVENVRPILSQTRSRKISCVSAQDTDQLDSGSRRERQSICLCVREEKISSLPPLSRFPISQSLAAGKCTMATAFTGARTTQHRG